MRTPDQISRWLKANEYRFDLPVQFFGDEPNALNRDWESSSVRWLLAASWPYEHAAGNQSIPAVCQAITDAAPDYLADRFYLPKAKRDLRLLERGGIPVFGIESKHELLEFDAVGTSISYLVLLMNFAKMLTMSGVPLRWRDREEQAGSYPMVIIGGQAYSAPAAMEPIADCLWLGEVEDEPGNGGIGQVCRRIALMKQDGIWASDRAACYAELAREFNNLHFPRFVRTHYRHEDRGLQQPSKQVSGYENLLPGQAFPRKARKVHDMDRIRPLRSAPLLYSDPDLGAGDLEVARGCPAWCSFCRLSWVTKPYRQRSTSASVRHAAEWNDNMGSVELSPFSPDFPMHSVPLSSQVTTSTGHLTLRELLQGKRTLQLPHGEGVQVRGRMEPLEAVMHTRTSPVCVASYSHGLQIHATQEHLIRTVQLAPRKGAGDGLRARLDRSGEAWREMRELAPGDWVRCYYGCERWPQQGFALHGGQELTPDMAWLLGLISGDGDISARLRLRAPDPAVRQKARRVLRELGCTVLERTEGYGATAVLDVVPGTWLRGWLAQFGFSGNSTKRQVPLQVRMSPRDVAAAYVTGCLDADGCVPDRQKDARHLLEVVHSTAAGSFTRQLAPLVLALGHPVSIHRVVSGSGVPCWNLVIHSAVDSDWSWLQFSEMSRHAVLAEKLEAGLDRPQKLFPGTGMDGVYYARVQSVAIDRYSAEVGDLEVPSARCFNINGMVVHNTQRKRLIAELLENVNDEADSVAMRIDDFNADPEYIYLQAIGGMDAVTLGLEGNSQRMRDLVGKGTSDADVVDAVTMAIRAGIRKVKLFMITNLPGEEPADVMRIVQLARKLAAVRDEMDQPNVRIQFSWTPLLIEAGTPMQWFAPTHADHTLIQVSELFRDLGIDFKIGTKAEPNKVAFFQLCQRASAEAGEAIVDVIADLDTGCWGGVPRDMRERLEAALRAHGFLNGFGDCFDERHRRDLFGWEYIDTGVSVQLMWDTYQQMVEFLTHTEAETYDSQYTEAYHGNEWVARCDTHCLGKSCGACEPQDLRLRTGYIRAAQAERDVDLAALRPVDQSTIAARLRIGLSKSERLRFVGNEHWRYSVRRAAYQAARELGDGLPAGFSIAKRTIAFATDAFESRGTSGADYVEFGITRELDPAGQLRFISCLAARLDSWIELGSQWEARPVASSLRRDAAVAFYELSLGDDPDLVASRVTAFGAAPYVKLTLRQDTSYFGLGTQEVNARDFTDDMWLTAAGKLRMLVRGQAGPYQLGAALMGRPGWIEASALPARRLEVFTAGTTGAAALQGDLLSPVCVGCGLVIPQNLLGAMFHEDYCPRCLDESLGLVAAGLPRSVSV